MAFCPKCNATIKHTDIKCDACGYDFPDDSSSARSGFAFSGLADFSLMIGGIAAGLGCLGAIIQGVGAAIAGLYWDAFFVAPITFFICFAMLVVFVRIQKV